MVNTTYLKIAQDFERTYLQHSEDDRGYFLQVWGVVKEHKPKKRAEVAKAMVKTAETIKSDMARRNYKSLVNMVLVYSYLPDRYINLTYIEFENLKRVLRLVKRLKKYYSEGVEALKPISEIWESGMSDYRYNNLLAVELKQIAEDYPVPQENEAVEQITLTKVWLEVEQLSDADKAHLLEALLAEAQQVA